MSAEMVVNGTRSTPAPVTIVVAPFTPIPNLPPGYTEVTRWVADDKTTVIRCWPEGVIPSYLEAHPAELGPR